MPLVQTLRDWAHRLKRDAMTLWFACRHPGTPWHAKALGAFVVAYALSPIDLIPDFIPVLGLLDDLLLLPALIWLALRWLPTQVLADCRQLAQARLTQAKGKPRSVAGLLGVLLVWAAALAALAFWYAQTSPGQT